MKRRDKIIVLAGAFDPPSLEEVFFIDTVKSMCDWFIVGLHSDAWLIKKRGKVNIPFENRRKIIEKLQDVDEIFQFNDDEDDALEQLKQLIKICYPDASIKFYYEEYRKSNDTN
jgi:bifunctional ADP-heptose synthase (sugar kinase/adenylyltransferase)